MELEGAGTMKQLKVVVSTGIAKALTAYQYESCSTQLDLPAQAAQTVLDWTRNHVAAQYLRDNGIETDPHITVKYGLLVDDSASVARVMGHFGAIRVRLGALHLFHTHPDYDVLVVRVHGAKLHAAHALLSQDLPYRETFSSYAPHLTLAYVAKGSCAHRIGQKPFESLSMTFDTLTFSDRNGEKSMVALRDADSPGQDTQSGLGMVFPPRAPRLLQLLPQ